MSIKGLLMDNAKVTPYGYTPEIKDPPLDTLPSDIQPPGVDEEREPQSLEEALTG